ncbi:MAG: glycosyl hydrolase, partial [Frankiales bacterium]|nr:glycosyl hydrolase [Frankiales bacterium]
WVTWCGPCNNAGFARGVATNAGGTWHQVTLPAAVPNRYLAGVTIDPADATGKTAYLVVNGFSRRFTEGPGAGLGHLWKTTDGGATWSNASASVPDVPASSLVISGGTWYLGTDLGVITSSDAGTSWKRVSGFPYVTVMQLKVAPGGTVYAATHGRGIWTVRP